MNKGFNVKDSVSVIFKTDIMLTQPTNEVIESLYLSSGADLMLESVTLDEVEHAYLGNECVSEETAMFESISTTRQRLSRTMRAFTRKLNQGLSGTGITAGTNDEGSADGNPSIGGAEIGRVRRVGNIPVMTARIPLSDGQSVSIIFHSPTSDGARIKNDDSLTAFRFLLNKRDVSHVVSPVNGRDISLPQVCMSLSNLIERNTGKFQKQAANAAKVKAEIESEITRAETLESQQVALIETGDQLQQVLDDKKDELTKLQKRLSKQKGINDGLRNELEKLKAQHKAKQAPTPADKPAEVITPPSDDQKPDPLPPEPPADKPDVKQPEVNLNTLHWYGMTQRPLGGGAVPEGMKQGLQPDDVKALDIVGAKAISEEQFKFGAAGYESPLSQDDIEHYDLVDFSNMKTQADYKAELKPLEALMSQFKGESEENTFEQFFKDYLKPNGKHAEQTPIRNADGNYDHKRLASLVTKVYAGDMKTALATMFSEAPAPERPPEELNQVDKAAADAIAFLKSVIELETGSTQELGEVRTKTREAISALNAATVYEENAGLVADAVKRQSQLLATIANTAMAGA